MPPGSVARTCPPALGGHVFNPTAPEPDRCVYCDAHLLPGDTARARLEHLIRELVADIGARRPWWLAPKTPASTTPTGPTHPATPPHRRTA